MLAKIFSKCAFVHLENLRIVTSHIPDDFLHQINNVNRENHSTHSGLSIHVSIVIVVENHEKWLKKILPSLLQNTSGINYEIVIFNNASHDKSEILLNTICDEPRLKIVESKKKISTTLAFNQAVESADGEYVVFMKPGVVPLNGWLNFLVHSERLNRDIGLVSSREVLFPSRVYSWLCRVIMQHRCGVLRSGAVFNDEVTSYTPCFIYEKPDLSSLSLSEYDERGAVLSSCILVAKQAYLELNGFDANFEEYDGAMIDLGLKLHQQGRSNVCSNASLVTRSHQWSFKKPLSEIELIDFTKLQNKWYHVLKRFYWSGKIEADSNLFSQRVLTIAIAVTDHGDNVTAGDYFTAQELAYAMKPYGWKVIYLSRKKNEWYCIPEKADVLLNLLDSYNLTKIPPRTKRLVKIAWARNWFDKWCEGAWFNDYDIVFSSSRKACEYINKHSRHASKLLPIASNPDRFNCEERPRSNFHKSDICFTGSYWDYPRDIVDGVSHEVLDKYRFVIYGAHWEKIDKFAKYSRGFVSYTEIPDVYRQTKIVIDDANHVTKPYGSVNSRVFDAIMSGALVITNGVEGSNELFNGELPYYESQNGLTKLINFYLNNEACRQEKIERLREIVLKKHTYHHRAKTLKFELTSRLVSRSIAIKIPAPSWEESHNWGDFHMAVSLKQALERENFNVILQVLPEWDNQRGHECDSVIVFRGLSRYKVKPHQLNIMWNISHPDKVSLKEYEEYDQVYIASELWAKEISNQVSVPVATMLQCTNPDVFHRPTAEERINYKKELLYVGNSRKVHRKLLQDLLPTTYDLSVYGKDWGELIPDKYIMGEHIPNHHLYKYYGSAGILLNDHWGDMRRKGFISNRIFDGLASAALIITDRVSSMGMLENYVKVYDTPSDLARQINDCLTQPESFTEQVDSGMEYVLAEHTFDHRAKLLASYINERLDSPHN